MSPGKRKRVTFAEEPVVVHYIPAPEPVEEGSEDDSGRKHSDIQIALIAQRQGELDSMQELEDESVMNDVAAAEEDYEKPAQAFNEAGVAFEPFHLKKERSEGYFDAEGNYIQYRLDEVKDAWLDSLKADDVSTSAPASAPHAKRAKHSAPVEIEELDADELLAYKRRLLDMLQTHETVLSALRRLGGSRQSGQASSGLSWKRARKSSGRRSSEEQSDKASSPTDKLSQPARSRSAVPVENKAAFDRLTEYASLLLQHGDRDIYSTPREEMATQLEAGEAAELEAVMGTLPEELKTRSSIAEQSVAEQTAAGQQAPADPEVDMFGDSEPQPQAATAVSDAAVDRQHTVSVPANQQADDASCSVVGPEGPQTHSNFTFDESTGTWFNADLGYYYDASHGLYGDAASGHWYSYRDGAYQLVY